MEQKKPNTKVSSHSYTLHSQCKCDGVAGNKSKQVVAIAKTSSKPIVTVLSADTIKQFIADHRVNMCPYYGGYVNKHGGMVVIGNTDDMRELHARLVKIYNLRLEAKEKEEDFSMPLVIELDKSIQAQVDAYSKQLPCHTHSGQTYSHSLECKLHIGWSLNAFLEKVKSGELSKIFDGYNIGADMKGKAMICILERRTPNSKYPKNDVNCSGGKHNFTINDDGSITIESPFMCAVRECKEECGLAADISLTNKLPRYNSNHVMYHYILPLPALSQCEIVEVTSGIPHVFIKRKPSSVVTAPKAVRGPPPGFSASPMTTAKVVSGGSPPGFPSSPGMARGDYIDVTAQLASIGVIVKNSASAGK